MNAAATPRWRSRNSDAAIQSVCDVTNLLAAGGGARECLPQVLALLVQHLELRDAAIAFQSPGSPLEVIGRDGVERPSEHKLSLLRASLGHALSTRMPWIVESEWSEPGLDTESRSDAGLDLSFVSVPIKDQDRVLGVLSIERAHGPGDQAGFCFDADVRMLTIIARVIAQSEQLSRTATEPVTAENELSPRPITAPNAKLQRPARGPEAAITGSSARWRATLDRARTAARTSATVILRGESGTGKELLARFIHEASPRAARPFVCVNCAALSETVLESELFGHERGAFTGAVSQRKGRFELADGGTLFLDEIGEISAAFQARLLRVLQVGEFERVGGTATLKVDVRLISATNRNLEADVREGRFRADLYYRISVVPVLLPALRERVEDIPALARELLKRFNQANGTRLSLARSAEVALMGYPFPGNVRELENCVRRAASLTPRAELTAADFSWLTEEDPHAQRALRMVDPDVAAPVASAPRPPASTSELGLPGEPAPAGDLSRERLIAALEQAGWVQAKAARLLGLTPRQIGYALQKLQIPVRRF